jgi:Transglutaminase-like superfamily
MVMLQFRAFAILLYFDFFLLHGDFNALYEFVRKCPVKDIGTNHVGVHEICAAVDVASIWYWKQVLCLQRSAAATCLLRHYGIPARMILAAQTMPFKAHAWVEVDGNVVSDKPYMREIYQVLDQC